MKLVWKLLRENISKAQLIGFSIANLIGLIIVLLAIQFYLDISPVFTEKDKLFKRDYVTVSKQVGLITGLTAKSNGFNREEIEDLKKQPFVKDVGAFTPSQYSVFAGFNNQNMGVGFNTEMFFEAVPDDFIDVKSEDWKFSPLDTSIPIILPKNYLDLYNFGFAESKSMPKLTEGLIGLINLDITIFTKHKEPKEMKGRIVGFSNRINTILVPESFMNWANEHYGNNTQVQPARLIVEINNVADPNLDNYFKSKGYEISGDNTTASKMAFFLKIIVGIVVSVGIVICLLSFFVLVLSIYLLLEKNMGKLKTLRLIGYTKSYVIRPYELLTVILNGVILVISLLIVLILRGKYLDAVNKVLSTGEPVSAMYIIGLGILIFLLLSLLNVFIIRRKVK